MMTLGLWNQTQPQRLGVYLPINNSNQLYSRKEIHSRDTIHVGDHLKHREIHYHLMWRKVIMHKYCWFAILNICQLEQLERLRYEDTLRRLMITNTIESYWIPSQKKTKSKSYIQRICQNFWILKQSLHATHLPKLLDKIHVQIWNESDEYWWSYRADTILSTDGRTDGRTTRNQYDPPFNFVEAGV